jgi:hypothetical protein
MNTTLITKTLATAAIALGLAAATLVTERISMPATYELGFGILVIGVLGGLAISEFRRGAPGRAAGVSLRRLPRPRFRA